MPVVEFLPRPRRVFIWLGVIWSLFVVAYGASQYVNNHVDGLSDRAKSFVKMLDLDAPAAIPQAYQALCLLVISALCLVIARHCRVMGERLGGYWLALAAIFLFLTFDGLCNIHNQFHVKSAKTQEERDAQGIFYFSWTIAYGAALIPIGLLFLRFLLKLPRKFGVLIFIAGVTFVIGALGMEMLYGLFLSRNHGQQRNDVTQVLVTAEESLEMLGEMLMIYACMAFMSEKGIGCHIRPRQSFAPDPIASRQAR